MKTIKEIKTLFKAYSIQAFGCTSKNGAQGKELRNNDFVSSFDVSVKKEKEGGKKDIFENIIP